VNVLLLDSLNTKNEDQSVVHSQVLKFLKSAKPGTRTAIFAMEWGCILSRIQRRPRGAGRGAEQQEEQRVGILVMLKGMEENQRTAERDRHDERADACRRHVCPAGMIGDLQSFMNENNTGQSVDRMQITLANLQRLAAFLEGFPGGRTSSGCGNGAVGL